MMLLIAICDLLIGQTVNKEVKQYLTVTLCSFADHPFINNRINGLAADVIRKLHLFRTRPVPLQVGHCLVGFLSLVLRTRTLIL